MEKVKPHSIKYQKLWKSLILLKEVIDGSSQQELGYCYISEDKILIDDIPEILSPDGVFVLLERQEQLPAGGNILRSKGFTKIETIQAASLSEESLEFLKKYLPYCFLSYHAKRLNRCIGVAHFAQSLDGKIATQTGDSRWIGNEENLIHAHRMRALCDGIIVGNNTVRNDRPQLTVRRVEGDNPQRIIIGASQVDLSSLMECSSDSILVVSNIATYQNQQVKHLRIPSDNCRINSLTLLQELYQKNIYSVYIEGGAMTTSNFLKDQAVDVLQLHIAPLLFGSGKQGISLPEITEVEQSQQFAEFDFYKIGDSVMFVGAL